MAELDPKRVLLVAGEASGDLHGGHLVKELQRQLPGVRITGIGGKHLRDCGVNILADVRVLSAAGLVEIVSSLRRHHRVMQLLKHQMDHQRPDVLVLIDYPGFNLFVAKEAKKRGIPVFFYIAPQVWAWGQGRAKLMERLIQRLAVIFPFEEAIFNAHGREFASYVGHPLLDELKVSRSEEDTRSLYGLEPKRRLLVLMPGSRRSEVRLLLPAMLQAAESLRLKGWQFILIKAPTIDHGYLRRVARRSLADVVCIENDTYNVLAAADAGIIASGTATLQAALLGCPPVILYKFSWLTYILARLFVGRRILGLPNVILGRSIFPELLQRDVTALNIQNSLDRLCARQPELDSAVTELRAKMGKPGASQRAAELLIEMLS